METEGIGVFQVEHGGIVTIRHDILRAHDFHVIDHVIRLDGLGKKSSSICFKLPRTYHEDLMQQSRGVL